MTNKIENCLVYLLILFCSVLFVIKTGTIDADFWSRLIMGHSVVENGSIMYNDIVSYTPTHIWYDHEWMSSALFYFVTSKLGYIGIFLLQTILCFLSISLVDYNILKSRGNYPYRFIYITLFMILLAKMDFYSTPRCQLFTYVFYPVLIYLLEKIRKDYSSKLLFLIPLLMILWINTHGAVLYGFGIIFLYGLGECLNKKPFKKYFIVLAISLLALIINPWGFDFIKFLFGAIYTDRQYIGEWQPVWRFPFNDFISYIINYCIIIFIFTFSFIKNKCNFKNLDYTKCLILLAAFILAVRYIKFNPIFLLTCFIFLYSDFVCFIDYIKKFFKSNLVFNIVIGIVVSFLALYSIFSNFSFKSDWYDRAMEKMPLKPLEFLYENNIKGKIFAPYFYGGFIAYKYYPDFKIYMDGRQEQVYSYDIFKKQMEFLFLKEYSSYEVLDEYEPDIILVDNIWRANMFLNEQVYFKQVYKDDKFTVYLAPSVQKFSYTQPKSITKFSKDNIFSSKSFMKAF